MERDVNSEERHKALMGKLDTILGHLPPIMRRLEVVEENVGALQRARVASNGNGKTPHA